MMAGRMEELASSPRQLWGIQCVRDAAAASRRQPAIFRLKLSPLQAGNFPQKTRLEGSCRRRHLVALPGLCRRLLQSQLVAPPTSDTVSLKVSLALIAGAESESPTELLRYLGSRRTAVSPRNFSFAFYLPNVIVACLVTIYSLWQVPICIDSVKLWRVHPRLSEGASSAWRAHLRINYVHPQRWGRRWGWYNGSHDPFRSSSALSALQTEITFLSLVILHLSHCILGCFCTFAALQFLQLLWTSFRSGLSSYFHILMEK